MTRKKKPGVILIGFILAIMSLLSCAITSQYSKAQLDKVNSIIVMTATPSAHQKYRVLGNVSGEFMSLFATNIDPVTANEVMQKVAYRLYGNSVDAIIGVQYFVIQGSTRGSILGTRSIGTAIQYIN